MATKPEQTPAKEAKDEAAPKRAPAAPKSKPAKKAEPAKSAASKAAPAATSKFAEFLKSKKIDPRRVLVASRKLEQLRPEDRLLRLARRKAKGAEGEDKPKEAPAKPRSGRPLTARALHAALSGGTLKGPVKTRLLRAVNHVLEQKKTDKVELKALF